MHNLQFIQIYSLIKRFIFISLSLLICFSSQAFAEPKITDFHLIDTDASNEAHINVIQALRDGDEIILPVVPKNLSIRAVTNGETQSVEMYIGQAKTSTENHEPYALRGDSNGKYTPVPELRTPGTIFISADPFSQDNASGKQGLRKTISVRIIQPDFIVNSDKDISDLKAGDGVCNINTPILVEAFIPSKGVKNSNLNQKQLVSTQGKNDYNLADYDYDWGDFIPSEIKSSCTLRAAIEEANALPGPQTILLPRPNVDGETYIDRDHTYKLTKKKELEITDSVTILGAPNVNNLKPTIDAGRQSRIFAIHRIQAVKSFASNQNSDNVDLSVVNANDPDNIEVIGQLLENAREAAKNIKLNFPLEFDDPIEVISVELINLDITQGIGGGITPLHGGAITIIGNKIHTLIKESVVRDSHASNGGGIAVNGGASLLLLDSEINNNTAGGGVLKGSFGGGGVNQRGGGISLWSKDTKVIVRNSVVRGNDAGRGGGISNISGSFDIENSLIINNIAEDIGGGVENLFGDLRATFSTIANNKVSYAGKRERGSQGVKRGLGGGIYQYKGSVSLGSTVLAKNTDEHKSPDCYTSPESVMTGYRNIVVGVLTSDCNLEDHVYSNLTGVDAGDFNNPLDPGFWRSSNPFHTDNYIPEYTGILFDNGGTKGNTFFSCPDYGYGYWRTERPQGAACDIGAIEVEEGLVQ